MTATLRSEPAKAQARSVRDSALDFTKGILVLFMVLYHWLNYFVGSVGHYYNYLRFLTPSFIFISGFVISNILLPKYETRRSQLAGRLTVRGLKLLAVFVALNLMIDLVSSGQMARYAFVDESSPGRLFATFVSGSTDIPGQKLAAFMVLVAIAYLMIASGALTLLCGRVKYVCHFACGLCLLGIGVLALYGMRSATLELLMIGLLGVVLGYAQPERIASVVSHPYALCGFYVVYLIVITIWNVTLPVQTAGVILTTALIYIGGKNPAKPRMVMERAILLGKYSLFGYIAQIFLLQMLRRVAWFHEHGVVVLLFSLFLGVALTLIGVELMDRARARVRLVDRCYRLVFA